MSYPPLWGTCLLPELLKLSLALALLEALVQESASVHIAGVRLQAGLKVLSVEGARTLASLRGGSVLLLVCGLLGVGFLLVRSLAVAGERPGRGAHGLWRRKEQGVVGFISGLRIL